MSLCWLFLAVVVFWLGVTFSQRRFVDNELDEAAQLPFIDAKDSEPTNASDDLLQA
ncbi:MAG: hypothetical protein V7756_14780 [Halopseudomonas sp.]|uniref:hypothetical protein n=1 Tax=Halopseudomonas sp. TaxID=2901191 RepID=UPI003002026C